MEERFAEIRIIVSTNDLDGLFDVCLNDIEHVIDVHRTKDIITGIESVRVSELIKNVLEYDEKTLDIQQEM